MPYFITLHAAVDRTLVSLLRTMITSMFIFSDTLGASQCFIRIWPKQFDLFEYLLFPEIKKEA